MVRLFLFSHPIRVDNQISDDSNNRTLPRLVAGVGTNDNTLLCWGISLAATCPETTPPTSTPAWPEPLKGNVRIHQISDKSIRIRIQHKIT